MPESAPPFPARHSWAAAVLLGLAGLLLNLRPVPLSPGTDLIFGGAAYLLAAVALGPWQGALAAGIASIRTVLLWHHPYAWLIFVAEALAVGHMARRGRRPLVADLVYWAVCGVPLLFATYWGLMGVRGGTAAVLFLKQPFNGMIDVLAVEALLLFPVVRRALGVRGRPPLRAAMAVVVTLAATLPALAFGTWTGISEWDRNVSRSRERLSLVARAHAVRLGEYVGLHEQEVRALVGAAERRGEVNAEQLQRMITGARSQFPGFVTMHAADSRGHTVACDPLADPAGKPMLGVRHGFGAGLEGLLDGRGTVVTEVFRGAHGTDHPVIGIAHPIVLGDTMAGYVLGALDLSRFPQPAPAPRADERLRVVDARGRILFDSRGQYHPGEVARSQADSVAVAAAMHAGGREAVTYEAGLANTAAGREAARMLAGVAPLPPLGWTVWAEQPFSVIQSNVAQSYVRLLALLLGVMVAALAVSHVLAAYLAAPLLRMRAAATALAAGDRAARVGRLPSGVPAEVSQLGRDLDDMASALAGRTEELEELSEIARALASTLDADEVLRQVTDAAARLVRSDGCGIALVQPGGGLRAADDAVGMLAGMAGHEIAAEGTLLGWVMRAGRPALVRDVASDPRVSPLLAELTGAGSALCTPLLGRSGVLGTLTAVRAPGAEPFTEGDLRLLDRLARQAAVAVENAHLVASERRRARESESIRTVARTVSAAQGLRETLEAVSAEAARIVGADACRVLLLRDEGEALELVAASGPTGEPVGAVLPVEGELLEVPLRRGRPAIVSDGTFAASVPLRVGDETLGVLAAERKGAAFGQEDARLLAAFADHAAVALRNAQLLEDAQAAARARSDFIATMSHELRTPLNAVLGHLQLLEMGIHGPVTEAQGGALKRIEIASRHLRGLIEEVLSFARLEAGRAETRVERVNLCELAAEVASVIEPLAVEKALLFRLEPCDPAVMVDTDPDKVRQILINLAGNAVKFTDEGSVSIGVVLRGEVAELSVRDTGPGIAPEDQARLFRPFEQLQTGFSRPHGGTGLGLYLSRQYADMLRGDLRVDSRPGEGSTFSLVLPVTWPWDEQEPGAAN